MSKMFGRILDHQPQVRIFQDPKGHWRWHISVNLVIIGASSEGYVNRVDCVNNILNLQRRIGQLKDKGEII